MCIDMNVYCQCTVRIAVHVSIHVCAVHVSLLGSCHEAAVAVFLCVYVGVGMRMMCTWAWACKSAPACVWVRVLARKCVSVRARICVHASAFA